MSDLHDHDPIFHGDAADLLVSIKRKMAEGKLLSSREAGCLALSWAVAALRERVAGLPDAPKDSPDFQNREMITICAATLASEMSRDVTETARLQRRVQVITDTRLKERVLRKAGLS